MQIQAQIQLHADVYVFSEGLTSQQIKAALLKPCADIGETVARLAQNGNGYAPRICVMPEGPQTIAYVSG